MLFFSRCNLVQSSGFFEEESEHTVFALRMEEVCMRERFSVERGERKRVHICVA